MKRWIWIVAALAISTGVYFTIRYGLRPKPIPVLNPTEFDDFEQIGSVIYKRLRHDIRAERLVVLGSTGEVPDDQRVWLGFLKAATADKEKTVLLAHDTTPFEHSGPWETALLADDALDQIKARVKAGQLIVIHAPTREASHLVDGSLPRKLDRVLRRPVLSLATLRFALRGEDRDSLQTQCLDVTDSGEFRLACAAQRVARKYARRGLDPSKIWAVMERHGLKEYLVFLNQ